MKTEQPITKPIAKKILSLIDKHGLVAGLGEPKPGEMCIMAVFNFALGRSHSDRGLDDCVDADVRHFDIALNDSNWSSPQARAKGMRREAIAKIGSNVLEKGAFRNLLALRVTQKVLPTSLRDYAQYCKPEYVNRINAIADECSLAKTEADVDARLARLDRLDRLASLDRLDRLDRLASLARLDRLASLASLARLDRLDRLASLDRLDRLARLDVFLSEVAEIAVQVLIELKSPGCEWLDLCAEVAV